MYYPTVLRPSSSLSTFKFFIFFYFGLHTNQGTAILYSDLLNNVQYEPDFIQDQYLSG